MDGLAEDLARVMVAPDGAQTRDQIAADRGSSRIIDLDADRTDLWVSRHAVGRRADVVALNDRAVGVDDTDLGAVGETFLAIGARCQK